jgi:hypothetical protein
MPAVEDNGNMTPTPIMICISPLLNLNFVSSVAWARPFTYKYEV